MLQEKQRKSINLVSNPHQFEINGLQFLGTSGQNIKDMLLVSTVEDQKNLSEAEICMSKIKQTLEIRHLFPTAPDTLRIYPFKESDPFVIDTPQDSATLELENDLGVSQMDG